MKSWIKSDECQYKIAEETLSTKIILTVFSVSRTTKKSES